MNTNSGESIHTLRPPATGLFSSVRANTLLTQALQVTVSVYQLMAVAAFIAALIFAVSWMKTPFLGAFYEQTLVFNGAAPSADSAAWDLYNQGVRLGDQLVSVNGVGVHSTDEIQNILNGFFPGESIPVTIRTAGGAEKSL